jgi:hypothetical protein
VALVPAGGAPRLARATTRLPRRGLPALGVVGGAALLGAVGAFAVHADAGPATAALTRTGQPVIAPPAATRRVAPTAAANPGASPPVLASPAAWRWSGARPFDPRDRFGSTWTYETEGDPEDEDALSLRIDEAVGLVRACMDAFATRQHIDALPDGASLAFVAHFQEDASGSAVERSRFDAARSTFDQPELARCVERAAAVLDHATRGIERVALELDFGEPARATGDNAWSCLSTEAIEAVALRDLLAASKEVSVEFSDRTNACLVEALGFPAWTGAGVTGGSITRRPASDAGAASADSAPRAGGSAR